MVELDRARGCLLGLATGDALGAPYEGGPIERLAWSLLGWCREGRRFTDDTQMTIDLAESMLAHDGHIDQDDLARRFAESYRWHRGYGPGAARLLKRVRRGTPWQDAARSVYPDGSFGNGAAMRAPALALMCSGDARDEAARRSAEITHAHPLGIDGAIIIAAATEGFLCDRSADDIFADLRQRAETDALREKLDTAQAMLTKPDAPAAAIVAALGNGITVLTSCPTALYLALRFRDAGFTELLQAAISCGGDVDTISAMAGAMWGAGRGAGELPEARIEGRERLSRLAEQISARP